MTKEEEQKEKREILLQDVSARTGSTYSDHTTLAIPEPSGRFAQHSAKPTVIQSGSDFPKIKSGPWSRDHIPDEPLIDATGCASNIDGRDCE
jgi:hypothetical protein